MTPEELTEKISVLMDEISEDGLPENKEMLAALSILLVFSRAIASGETRALAECTADFAREQFHKAMRESEEISSTRLN